MSQDDPQAWEWYCRAEHAGSIAAKQRRALMLLNGRAPVSSGAHGSGTEEAQKNTISTMAIGDAITAPINPVMARKVAMKLLEEAKEQGCPDALFTLGQLALTQGGNLPCSLHAAVIHYARVHFSLLLV